MTLGDEPYFQMSTKRKKVFFFILLAFLLQSPNALSANLIFTERCAIALSGKEFSDKKSRYFIEVRTLLVAGELLIDTPFGDKVTNIVNTAVYSMYPLGSMQAYAGLHEKVTPSQKPRSERIISTQVDSAASFLSRMSESMLENSALIDNSSFLGELRSVRTSLDELVQIISKNCSK